MTLCLMSQVSDVSASESTSTFSSKCFSTALMADTLTYLSPDMMSVNSCRGPSALLTDSSTSMCCQEGIKCDLFLSAPSTCLRALTCSRILSTIFCSNPHLVGQAPHRVCFGRFSDVCTCVRSLLFFQLWEKVFMILWQIRYALDTRLSSVAAVTARCKL